MHWAKNVADGLTAARIGLAVAILGLALFGGADALHLAGWLLLAAWISDVLDGPLARKSGQEGGWLGSKDLEIDIMVGASALIYLAMAGFISAWVAVLHLGAWSVVFWRNGGVPRPYGVLFQAPIYVLFGITALRLVPEVGRRMAAYAIAVPVLGAKEFWGRRVPAWWRQLRGRWSGGLTGRGSEE
jgi:cardiolipin synthase